MKAIFKTIVLLFFFNLISIHYSSSQQCGYTNEAPIVNYQVANRNYRTIEIRVQVYAIMNSDGSKGVTRSQAVTSMQAVAQDFLDNYDIKLNYCVREVRDDKIYNFENEYAECYLNNIQFSIHENCSQYACGEANSSFEFGNGWGLNDHAIIMHEFGHIFGLAHTHNNSHRRNASCLANPSGCAETVHQRNCNDNGPLTCEIDGDGICDTPADPQCYNDTWCTPFVKDRCEVSYPTPIPQDLIKNYMSYYHGSRIEFSPDQKAQMHGYIFSNYLSFIGEKPRCDNSTINSQDLGNFESDQLFQDQTLYFSNGINAKNCRLIFLNCTVHLAGEIKLENAILSLRDTRLTAGAHDYCTGAVSINWKGIYLRGKSKIIAFRGSIIETLGPTSISSVTTSDNDHFVLLDNFFVSGGITVEEGGIAIQNNTIINGALKVAIFSINSRHILSGISVNLNSEVIAPSSEPFSPRYGVNAYNASILFNKSILKGEGIKSSGNRSTIVTHSSFEDIYGEAINLSNNDYFKLDDSHINSGINITNPIGYDITSNNFNSRSSTLSNSILVNNQDDISHNIQRNRLVNKTGIKTIGQQTGLKMLCNSFTSDVGDFWWENDVAPLQGFDFDRPAGNIFSTGNVQNITGMSDVEINYNFNTLGANEDPINNNHNNLRKRGFTTSAGCGLIGASWTPPGSPPACPPGINCTQPCPPGINCTQPCPTGIICSQPCPLGINCTQPCPPGINCTQPCPPGINCTQPCPIGINCLPTNPTGCPQGIDCTQPCPIGIDCSQDCPPGINCTQPCPVGIDCTQPCPLGINCYVACPPGINCTQACPPGIKCDQPCTVPQGCHEPCITCLEPSDPIWLPKPCDDPLFTYLDDQYNQSEYQYIALRDAYMTLPQYRELSELLNQQSLINKPRIIQLFTQEPKLVTPQTIKLVFDNSNIYTESEVVSLIKLNPALMLDPTIKPIISKSRTFTNQNIREIQFNYNQNTQSHSIENLWAIDAKKTKMSAILHYGLYRLAYYDMRYCERYNQWVKRFNSLSAELGIIDNLLNQNRVSEINTLYTQLLNDDKYTQSEKFDISQHQSLISLLINVANNSRNLSQLSLAEQKLMNDIAQSPARCSAAKAQDILTAFYYYSFPEFVDQEDKPEMLYFLGSQNTMNRSKNSYEVNIAPNPTSGNITITHNIEEVLTLNIVSMDGQQHLKIDLQNKVNTITIDHLMPGIYFYSVTNESNFIIKSDKIVLIK